MKKILILGAGLVARPLVRYLLDRPDFVVKVASRTVSKAQKLIDNHPQGKAQELNLTNEEALRKEVSGADLVISMVPYAFHPKVAEYCIAYGKHMVTTSYVSDAMKALDSEARRAGVLILNEIGLDPGIDHMEAMRIINEVEAKGGEIEGFTSFCGGLPAPEANTNPFGYKFSWSPIGVLLAGKNSAQYLKDGKEVFIPSERLFDHYSSLTIEGLGDFEAYPNRNSLPYIETYGIRNTKTMLRGTIRYIGWCKTLKAIRELGLLTEEEEDWTGFTCKAFLRHAMKNPPEEDMKKAVSARLNIEESSDIIQRIEWLGLFSEDHLPLEKGSAISILAQIMTEKMKYEKSERDMIILQHEFIASYPGKRKEKIISSLVDFGFPHGDTSMARTVGLPAAIGSRLILEGKIKENGVHIPVLHDIYVPILQELREQGIAFKEKREKIR